MSVPFLILLSALSAGVQQPPAATSAGTDASQKQAASPEATSDLPVSLARIQKGLAKPQTVRLNPDRQVFRVEIFGQKPTIEDILGKDFLKGPVPYGGMWPLLLVIFGAYLVWTGATGRRRTPANDSTSTISGMAILGGVSRGSNSREFRGGDLTAILGGCEIDLRRAAINGEAVIDIFAMWGGIELKVPEDWAVESRVTPLLGGVEDKTRAPQGSTAHRLVLRGFAIMATPYLDEAERCGRVALLHEGRLLALDAPATLTARLHGQLIEVITDTPRPPLEELAALAGVEDVQSFGERAHVRLSGKSGEDAVAGVREGLEHRGLRVIVARAIPPSLEDVFIDLIEGAATGARAASAGGRSPVRGSRR